jgi:hypothetical protein
LIRSSEDQVGYLRREVEDWKDESRRKDAILMSLAQRIPELLPSPGSGPRDAPQAAPAEAPAAGSERRPAPGGVAREEGAEQRRPGSWWRQLFEF